MAVMGSGSRHVLKAHLPIGPHESDQYSWIAPHGKLSTSGGAARASATLKLHTTAADAMAIFGIT